MDHTYSNTHEPYLRVQNQISCDDSEPVEGQAHVVDSCCCSCHHTQNKTQSDRNKCRPICLLTVVATLSLLLSIAAVSMVMVQWITNTTARKGEGCPCPSEDQYYDYNSEQEYVFGDAGAATSSDVTASLCPTCRTRRDDIRRQTRNGRGRARQRKCTRACHNEIQDLRAEISFQNSSVSAIHFHGFPPSVYELGQDGAYKWWRPPTWYDHMTGYHYNHTSGHVTVLQGGLYFVYSQVDHPAGQSQAHAVMINDGAYLKCTKSVSPATDLSSNGHTSCYVGGATLLFPNDRVWIKGTHTNGMVQIEPKSSYWGIVKLKAMFLDHV